MGCKCPGTKKLKGDVLGGSRVFPTEAEAAAAAASFAQDAEPNARDEALAEIRKVTCDKGPQGQLCLAKVFGPTLKRWTAVGAIRTPPAPYVSWLARGGCTWSAKIECDVIELAELGAETAAVGGKPGKGSKRKNG